MSGEAYQAIPGRYGVDVTRTGDAALSCRVPVEPDKLRADGSIRPAAVMMGVDMAAGLAAGLGVSPSWTMTADAAVQFVGPVREGPIRIDARCVKAGRTQALAELTIVDEGADDAIVAVATANHGVMAPDFTNEFMALEIGGRAGFERPAGAGTGDLEDHFGVSVESGIVRIPVDDRTRNPWGILHGGLTGLVMEVTADAAGVSRLDEVVIRYLRPVREGPGRAQVTDEHGVNGRRLLKIEMYDEGADRLAVLGTVIGR